MRYFLDTEFNGMGGDLISLAMVGEDGREFYHTLVLSAVPIPWVAENVFPILRCAGAEPTSSGTTAMMARAIMTFLMYDLNPIIVADWPDDIAYFFKALIVGPGLMVDIRRLTCEMVRVDAYPTDLPGAIQHNALWDARALRHKIMG